MWPARLSVNCALKLMSLFSPTFSGALVNGTALTFCRRKKHFSPCVLAKSARLLCFFSLKTLHFLTADGAQNLASRWLNSAISFSSIPFYKPRD